MDNAALYEFMAGHCYGTLSSVSSEGALQGALIGVAVTAKLEIIFDTLE